MSPKTLFLKDEDLSKWWVTIARDDRFGRVLTYARSAMMASEPTKEQVQGAEKLIVHLETLSDNEPSGIEIASPGLHHTIDKMPEKPKE